MVGGKEPAAGDTCGGVALPSVVADEEGPERRVLIYLSSFSADGHPLDERLGFREVESFDGLEALVSVSEAGAEHADPVGDQNPISRRSP